MTTPFARLGAGSRLPIALAVTATAVVVAATPAGQEVTSG